MESTPAPSALFVLLSITASIAIVLGLRKTAPGKPRLAMALAILFGPCGHLYLRGAAWYVLLMYAAWLGLLIATPFPPFVSGLLLMVLSALLMSDRLRKAARDDAPQL